MKQGLFFSLDGVDGAGKSTQCRLLAQWLRGRGFEVTECHDPGGTEIGTVLRQLLLDQRRHMTLACETFLFMASRAQLTAEIIRPALDAGRMVVSDRYLLANLVYQGHAAGVDPQFIHTMGLFATGGLEPDLTFVLDLPVEQALARLQGPLDRMESRGHEFHERVRQGFRAEAERRPDRIRLVDASQDQATIHQQICQALAPLLPSHCTP